VLRSQPRSISITAVALLNGHININKISQHSGFVKYKQKMDRDKISSSTALLGFSLCRRKCLTTLENRFYFPVENFSASSDGDKPSKALQKPIELSRNGTLSQGKKSSLPRVYSGSKND